MNEEQKNIETCLAENILSEVANVPTDAQFRSLVEESFDQLQQQAAAQVGWDGYKEVVMYHKPYTFTSQVKQMKSNLILLLRRLWRFPFGRGTLRSLADMWQHYITRLKGNPEYGIPSRLSSLTDLPSAPALLADRDMSSGIRFGENHLPDGISLAHLLCSTDAANAVTEIADNNTGWEWKNTFSQFPNSKRITINAAGDKVYGSPLITHIGVEELNVPYLNRVIEGNSSQGSNFFQCPNLRVFRLDRLVFWQGGYVKTDMPVLKELNMPNCTHYLQSITYGGFNAPELEKWVLGKLESFKMANNYGTSFMESCHNLIHIEIGEGTACSLPMQVWSPTTAISERLPEFLSNFKTYIAERLRDNGSGLTLTLSQAVRDAIQQDPEIVSIITGKGWTISPAPTA